MIGQLPTLIEHLRYPDQVPYRGNISADLIDYLEELQSLRTLEERVSAAISKLDAIRPVMWEETVAEVVGLLSDAP